jgi:GT2 family glycosyltransferase
LLPTVAIVILNYNGKNFLAEFLPSVLASTYHNKKIIVADNASTDDSVQFLQQQYPTVQILLNLNNDGYAGGYNWALKRVEADYYVLLNSDVEVTPNWIEPIIELMENDSTIAACQPKILSWYNKQQFEYAGACGGFIDALGYPFSRGRIFDTCENDHQQYNSVEKIFWATGAAMFLRSNVFLAMNGFDASFFAHMEEIDLCWRMQLAGYSIYVQPNSIVYHVGGGTLPKGYQKTYLNFRNNLIMLSKNLPLHERLYKIPLRFLLDGVNAWKDLLTGNSVTSRAVFNAHKATVQWWFLGKKNHQQKKPFSKLKGVYTGSIVWQYFIKKQTTFSEIMKEKN